MPGELTHLIIHDFEIYLRTVVALKPNSATKTLKFFKTVVIFAQKCGVMTHDPFLNHHFHLEYVDRGFLTDDEIRRIMERDFDIPRHTFATMSLSKGVPIESVSKMLGHTNIKTTQIYARITNKKIEQDMMQAADKFNGFKEYFKS